MFLQDFVLVCKFNGDERTFKKKTESRVKFNMARGNIIDLTN